MKREIYEVYAKVVDSNGTYNTLNGYPKVFDSHAYDDSVEKAKSRAYGEYHSALGTMYTRDDRQMQVAMILRGSDGLQIEKTSIGTIADLPDPTYVLTVNNGTGSGEYTENTIVHAVANNPEVGKSFKEWTGTDELNFASGDKYTSSIIFVMPAEAVEITATYEDIEQQ